MQEQNRVFMEKKLDMQIKHQEQKLNFLQEESKKKYAVESRRLDLEFMRMEHQREQQQVEYVKRRGESRI